MADGTQSASFKASAKKEGKIPELVDIQVGARIRFLRKEKGVSQQTLAEKLGVTFQQVQKYERGANRISASMMDRAAKALGVPASALFGENASIEDAELLQQASTAVALRLLIIYNGLDPRGKAALMGAASGIKESMTLIDD